jgi:hypothetical protein
LSPSAEKKRRLAWSILSTASVEGIRFWRSPCWYGAPKGDFVQRTFSRRAFVTALAMFITPLIAVAQDRQKKDEEEREEQKKEAEEKAEEKREDAKEKAEDAVDDRDNVVDTPGTDRSQDRRQDRRRDAVK